MNVRITVPEMANGGRSRPTCDRLLRELSAGVNSPKEGSLRSPPNHGNDDHTSSIRQWMCQTTYDRYDRELSAEVNSPKEGRYIARRKPRQRRPQIILSVRGAIDWNSKTSFKDAQFRSQQQNGKCTLPLFAPGEPTGTAKCP